MYNRMTEGFRVTMSQTIRPTFVETRDADDETRDERRHLSITHVTD